MLNETNSRSFFAFLCLTLFFTGGWIPLTIAFVVALASTHALRGFVLNKVLPPPSNGAVLVTGASTGIGEDAVYRLAKKGLLVFAGVRKDADGEKLLKKYRESGGNIGGSGAGELVPIILDVTKRDHIARAVQIVEKECKQRNKQLFALVNNAGFSDSTAMELVPIDKLRFQYEVNVFGVVALTQAFLPMIRAAQMPIKRIVMLSSGVGLVNIAGQGPYQSTKHAIESISDTFRMELAKWKIDVVVLEPGMIATSFAATARKNREANSDEAKSAMCGESVVRSYVEANAALSAKNLTMKPSHVSVVTDTLERTLFDSNPLTRYRSGSDCLYQIPIALLVPDRLRDLILAGPFRN